jgi:hypothetical protein
MDNDKSILEKITDTVKDIAHIAADAANHALKAEEPPLKPDERAVAYMPLAADGLVSNPLMVPPVAMVPVAKKKRTAPKRVAKTASKKTAKKAGKKSTAKNSKKTARKASKKANKKAAKKVAKKRKGKRRS